MRKKSNPNQPKTTSDRKVLMRILILCLITVVLNNQSFAQKRKKVEDFNVSVTHAELLGKTKPIRDLVRVASTSQEKKEQIKRNKKVPENFIGRGTSKVKYPEKEHQGVDPLWQRGKSRSISRPAESIVNIDGLSNSFGSPHDPTGEIGDNYYVQSINATTVGVYDKEGNLVDSFAANTLWTGLGVSSLGDPIILYDQEVKRWVITEFANPAELLIAVSDTDDPLGTYNAYRYTTPNFPDYPKYGIWSNSYVVTTNEQGPGALHQYFIDRQSMLNGDADVTIQRIELGGASTEAGFYVTTPADWTGDTPPVDDFPIVMRLNDSSWGDIDDDAIEVYEFDIDFADENNTQIFNTTITTTPYDANPCAAEVPGTFACIPQLDGQGIDGIPEVIMNVPIYRNFGTHEAMVLNFITDVTDGDNLAGIRWVELRRSGGDWELYQEGTFAPDDGLHRFMGSIALDGNGNIGLSYNVSSETTYAGIRFTGRMASDPLGEMTVDEVIVVEGTNPINTFRFGDYAHMTVDPSDEQTFWYTSEYAGNGSDNSLTRIHAFKLQQDTIDVGVAAFTSPESSSGLTDAETVTVEFKNFGLDPITAFEVGLIYEGAVLETFDYSGNLDSDETFTHAFSTTIDMSELGDYELTAYSNLTDDENERNDTLRVTITNYPDLDAKLLNLQSSDFTCDATSSISFDISNNGFATLTTATIEVSVNGNVIETINWTGSLELNQTEEVETTLSGLTTGINSISVTVSSPNGGSDEDTSNNTVTGEIDFIDDLEEYTVSILTDDYPGEITWVVEDYDTEEVIASGGPYPSISTLYETTFCVPSTACLVFEIFDSAGDGICCAYGEGAYEITNSSGEVVASGGEYGSSESQLVCVQEFDIDAALEIYVEDETCLNSTIVEVEITNLGNDVLTEVGVNIESNGNAAGSTTWTGSLALFETDIIEVEIDITSGENNIVATLTNPNGGTDGDASNNEASGNITYNDDQNEFTLEIVTDSSPGDITWEVTELGTTNVVASGGPYVVNATKIESMCLDISSCYTLTFYDASGDGICCGSGNGSYELSDPTGQVVIASDGEYGSQESNDFCGESCMLTADIEVTNATSTNDNGVIMITASGGVQPYAYSIDGGTSFQSSNIFDGLESGEYDVIVEEDGVCTHSETVIVDMVTSANGWVDGSLIEIAPNPSNGVFQLSVTNHSIDKYFLTVQIVDMNGRLIQERRIGKYDDKFTGQISLYDYPDGIYFLRFVSKDIQTITRILKQ